MSRPTFHSRYTIADKQRDPHRGGPRLLDYITSVVHLDSARGEMEPGPKEFAVVDWVRKEKAFVQMPKDGDINTAHAMVESYFAMTASRVANSVWVV